MSAAGDALGDSINNAIIALGTLPVPSQTIWRTIANILVAPGAGTAIPGLIVGGEISNNVTTPNTKLDVASGYCTDSTYASKMTIQPWTIDLSTSWAAGNGFGKLNTGVTWTVSTTYHIFVIAKADLSVIDFVVDTSTTPASLPGGCTLYRRIGSRQTDVSGNLIPVNQIEDVHLYSTILVPIDGVALSVGGALYNVGTPAGIRCRVIGHIAPGLGQNGGNPMAISVTSPLANDQTPSQATHLTGFRGITSANYNVYFDTSGTEFTETTDTLSRLRFNRANVPYQGTQFYTTVQILGYTDTRGKFGGV